MAWKEKGEEKHACMQGGKLAGKVVLEVAQQVHAARQEWPSVGDEICNSLFLEGRGQRAGQAVLLPLHPRGGL